MRWLGLETGKIRALAILCWGMVDRARHRNGLGTLLLMHRLEEISKGGFDAVEILTSQHSAEFFARAGFVEVGIVRDKFAVGLHEHRMLRTF